MAQLSLTITINAGGGLPAGVTLQAIDGEIISNGVQTHSYYSQFSRLNSAFNKHWDDPTFFPIHSFYIEADETANGLPKALDLGYNNCVATFSNPVWSSFDTSKFWYFSVDGGDGAPNSDFIAGTYTDEPQNESVYVPSSPGALIAGGPIWINHTINSLVTGTFGWQGSVDMTSFIKPNTFWTTNTGQHRGVDITGVDLYWYAGSTSGQRQNNGWQCANQSWGTNSLTPDQMARGNNYGCMIDLMRRDWMPSGALTKPAAIPLTCFVENSAGNDSSNGAREITPDEMICAAWSSIIHGARVLSWFYYTDIYSLPATDPHYIATKKTNATVQSLASVLNSPFAVGYVNVTPNGYTFPSLDQTRWKAFTNLGIQCCAKYVNGKFYIIASTTYGESGYTAKTATFSLAGGAGATATVLYSSDNTAPAPITISAGQFQDTFSHPWSVRFYRID